MGLFCKIIRYPLVNTSQLILHCLPTASAAPFPTFAGHIRFATERNILDPLDLTGQNVFPGTWP
jgi:hypothetical protein